MRKAFTLVELLVVVAIVMILASLTVSSAFKIFGGGQQQVALPKEPLPATVHLSQGPTDSQDVEWKGSIHKITIEGNKYEILYNGPDDVKIRREK